MRGDGSRRSDSHPMQALCLGTTGKNYPPELLGRGDSCAAMLHSPNLRMGGRDGSESHSDRVCSSLHATLSRSSHQLLASLNLSLKSSPGSCRKSCVA